MKYLVPRVLFMLGLYTISVAICWLLDLNMMYYTLGIVCYCCAEIAFIEDRR
jgi:hypothetical protein